MLVDWELFQLLFGSTTLYGVSFMAATAGIKQVQSIVTVGATRSGVAGSRQR